jgi:hypothetical protein
VAAFLRVINALENIRASIEQIERSNDLKGKKADELLELAVAEIKDSISVLAGAGLHAPAVAHLKEAKRLTNRATNSIFSRRSLARAAIGELDKARAQMVE